MAFPLTRRSVVLAVRSADARWGASEEDAEDLAQGFFATALEKETFARFDPARGRFRTYLLTCLDAHAANARRAARRAKRGGDVTFVPLDAPGADGRGLEVAECVKKIESAGGRVTVPKMAIPGVGWLVYAADTEGNAFGVLQADATAR